MRGRKAPLRQGCPLPQTWETSRPWAMDALDLGAQHVVAEGPFLPDAPGSEQPRATNFFAFGASNSRWRGIRRAGEGDGDWGGGMHCGRGASGGF